MTEEYWNNSDVEQHTARSQVLFLNEFARFSRPIELILPIPIDMSDYKYGQTEIGENYP
ncbi:hypothetical protein D3C77_752610 [compost metagenome]